MKTVNLKNVKAEESGSKLKSIWIPVFHTPGMGRDSWNGETHRLDGQASQEAALSAAKTAMLAHPNGISFSCLGPMAG